MTPLFVVLLAFQVAVINNPAALLYDQIYEERRPAERLKLILEFERKFVTAKGSTPPTMRAQVMGFAMDLYQEQKDWPKMIEYGEKALQHDPGNLRPLTVLARQYALSGENVAKAGEYARRAIDAVAKRRTQKPDAGFTKDTWEAYLKSHETSARGTLDYIRSMTTRLVQRPKKP
jgi:hypothetical protein